MADAELPDDEEFGEAPADRITVIVDWLTGAIQSKRKTEEFVSREARILVEELSPEDFVTELEVALRQRLLGEEVCKLPVTTINTRGVSRTKAAVIRAVYDRLVRSLVMPLLLTFMRNQVSPWGWIRSILTVQDIEHLRDGGLIPGADHEAEGEPVYWESFIDRLKNQPEFGDIVINRLGLGNTVNDMNLPPPAHVENGARARFDELQQFRAAQEENDELEMEVDDEEEDQEEESESESIIDGDGENEESSSSSSDDFRPEDDEGDEEDQEEEEEMIRNIGSRKRARVQAG